MNFSSQNIPRNYTILIDFIENSVNITRNKKLTTLARLITLTQNSVNFGEFDKNDGIVSKIRSVTNLLKLTFSF